MENKKSGKKAIGMVMAAIMIASIFAMIAPAFGFHKVPVPTGDKGIYFLDPPISNASGHCNNAIVEVWVNSSIPIRGGSVRINTSDQTCANITSCTPDPLGQWTGGLPESCLIEGAGESAFLSFNVEQKDTKPAGNYHVANITVHCNSSIGCCLANLSFIPGRPHTYIVNETGVVYDVTGENGTFVCGNPINVTKTVKDPTTGLWVEGYSFPMGTVEPGVNVTFNVTVHAKCCNLTNITVTDVLDDSLTYYPGNATVNGQACEPQVVGQNLTWSYNAGGCQNNFTKLDECNRIYIEFNATVNRYGKDYNTVTADGWCNESVALPVPVSDTDDAYVNLPSPARLEVIKKVWDPDTGKWVKVIPDAKIGDIYRFNCTIHNAGSAGMDLEDIRVWDLLSDSLEYADNATMVTPDGIKRNINPPDSFEVYPNGTTHVDWIINNWLQSNLTLQPCQRIFIEFDAKVVNYGNNTNMQYAKGWYAGEKKWIYANDTAWINIPHPDLNVSEITLNPDVPNLCDMAFGPTNHSGAKKQCNNISAVIEEDNGVDVVFPFNVTFEITNSTTGAEVGNCTVTLSGLVGKTQETVYCNCSFYPFAYENYTINVTVDPEDVIRESDEGNNTMVRNITAYVNCLKGDSWQDGRNITNLQCHEQGTINLTYSVGDSARVSGWSSVWPSVTVNWTANDLPIPPTETCIKKARLYVYYDWDARPALGLPNVTNYFNLSFNGHNITPDAIYTDRKMDPFLGHRVAGNYVYTCACDYGMCKYNYDYGMVAYDVTDKFTVSGNTAILYNSQPPNSIKPRTAAFKGMLLVVVYNNSAEPERIIYINEGFDRLYAGADYGVSPDEATTYAVLENGSCKIPLNKIGKATLVTITMDASTGDVNRLYFNGQLLGTDAWTTSPGAPCEIKHNVSEVLPLLQATNNTAAYQSNGDWFEATNAFLILEKNPKHIRVMPENLTVQPQEEFTVDIIVNTSGHDVYGVQYKLYYNNSVLRAEMQNKGDFLGQPGETLVIKNEIHHNEGYVEYAETMKGNGSCTVGNGTLATIEFIAIGERGAMSGLNFSDVMFVDCNKSENIHFVAHNGTVIINKNRPPVVIATSKHRTNHVAKKYPCITKLCACKSYDPDAPGKGGNISYVRWAFGDGQYGTSEGTFEENCQKEHEYTSYNWEPIGDPNGHYVPMNVILTLTDDGCPPLTNSSDVDVNVYIAGDANGDGKVNILDAVWIGIHWEEQCADLPSYPPAKCCYYWTEERTQQDGADLNNDCKVNILDAVIVGANWEYTAW